MSHRFGIPHRRGDRNRRYRTFIHQRNRSQSNKFYTPDVEGTKAEADAKRAKRAKIVFIILDILLGLSVLTSCADGRGGGCRELMVKKQTSARAEGGKTIFQFNLVQLGI